MVVHWTPCCKLFLMFLSTVSNHWIIIFICTTFNLVFITGYETTSYNKWTCKTWLFVNHSAKTISGWTLVSVTVEQLLVIYFPLKVKSICMKKVAFKILIVISFFCTSAYLHYFWSYGPSYKEVNGTSIITATYSVSHEYPELEFYIVNIRPCRIFC